MDKDYTNRREDSKYSCLRTIGKIPGVRTGLALTSLLFYQTLFSGCTVNKSRTEHTFNHNPASDSSGLENQVRYKSEADLAKRVGGNSPSIPPRNNVINEDGPQSENDTKSEGYFENVTWGDVGEFLGYTALGIVAGYIIVEVVGGVARSIRGKNSGGGATTTNRVLGSSGSGGPGAKN